MDIKSYTDENLDFFGDELNRRFDSDRLKSAKTLDVYDVVEFIHCSPDWKYLTPDQSILGMTVFEPYFITYGIVRRIKQGISPKKSFLKKGRFSSIEH